MSSTAEGPVSSLEPADPGSQSALQEQARRHLWMHFTRMGAYSDAHEIPIIVRGEGCYVYDEHGNRYLDGLASLFCSTSGTAAPTWRRPAPTRPRSSASSPTGPTRTRASIELATKIASLAPGDLNRVFFTNSGSEAVESALKLARQYHKLTGHPNKYKVIAREIAYHGTTLGALSATGVPRSERFRSSRCRPAAAMSPTPTSTGCPTT